MQLPLTLNCDFNILKASKIFYKSIKYAFEDFGMAKKIYVGNLSFSTTEETLRNQFSQFGKVVSVQIILDRETNRSKGFGFVEMEDEGEADSAITGLNQKDIDGRRVRVSEAQEKKRNF